MSATSFGNQYCYFDDEDAFEEGGLRSQLDVRIGDPYGAADEPPAGDGHLMDVAP